MLDMPGLRWDYSHPFNLFQNHGDSELPADEFSVAKTFWLCHTGRTGVRQYRPPRHLDSWGIEVSRNTTAISYTAAATSVGAYHTYRTLNYHDLNTYLPNIELSWLEHAMNYHDLNTQCQEQTQGHKHSVTCSEGIVSYRD